MNTKISLVAAVLCCALAACETTREWRPPTPPITTLNTKECKKGQPCDVDVTVTDDGTRCKPDVVTYVDVKDLDNDAKHTITWKLPPKSAFKFSNESYKFAIFIKDDPRGAFSDAKVTGGGRELTLKFDKKSGTANQRYAYAITVQRDTSAAPFCETLDPWFIS